MPATRTQHPPTFFWQGLLILLPVAVLAVVGVISLRQDKIIARHDATERAQAIADDVVARIWNELTVKEPAVSDLANGLAFEIDSAGRLVFPATAARVPVPKPLDPAELDAGQKQLWVKLNNPGAGRQDSEGNVRDFRDFLDTQPPKRFAAAASYGLGMVLARQGKSAEAAKMFDRVVKEDPEVTGESGLPLQPLAQLKLLELAAAMPDTAVATTVTVESFCSNIVCRPTLLTPELFKQAEQLAASHPNAQAHLTELEKWQRLWQHQERARQMYAAARDHFISPNNPASEGFSLVSIGGHDQRNVESEGAAGKISLPRLFWFTTPNQLFVPKVQNSETEAAQNSNQGWMLIVASNAAGNSDAIRTMTHWMGNGILDRNWLAVASGDRGTNCWYVCFSESELGFRIKELAGDEKHIPGYFGIGVEMAGRKIKEFAPDLHLWTYRYVGGGKSSGREVRVPLDALATNVLASAARAEQLLKVKVYLTSPDKLYQLQRARTFWFGALVAVSAAAALIGLLTAWRVFRQQRQLSEMKSNFVSSVSHELRAPIASVRLMAENLAGGKIAEAPKQKDYYGFIVQECRRLSSLIENVLDFSRIEQGRKQYEFEPTDMLALVQTTVKLMEPYAAEKGVILKLEASLATSQQSEDGNIEHRTPNIELEMDGRAIQQALVNLIDNAIKHSPKGETVTVELEVRNAECGMRNESASTPGHSPSSSLHPRLTLSVIDHGPGIPPGEHAKIFERFYRRGSELRRETQGVGIGLSLVKHIVEAHDGQVRVESEVGKGSRFTIELPAKNETSNIER